MLVGEQSKEDSAQELKMMYLVRFINNLDNVGFILSRRVKIHDFYIGKTKVSPDPKVLMFVRDMDERKDKVIIVEDILNISETEETVDDVYNLLEE